MRLQTLLIMVLVFGLSATGFGIIFGTTGSIYQNVTGISAPDTSILDDYEFTSEAKVLTDRIENSTREGVNDPSGTDLFGFVAGAMRSIRFVFEAGQWTSDMTQSAVEDFGIPEPIPTIFIIIVILVISFAIMSAIFKWAL